MDLQPPQNLPMHDESAKQTPMPTPPVPVPIQSMPSAAPSAADDMFSSVERSVPSVQAVSAPSVITPPIFPSATVSQPPQPAPSRVLPSLPESEHPPILHYILISLGVVVVLGLIAGGVWFFAIRRPARQVMETLPAVPVAATSSEDTNANAITLPTTPTDEPIGSRADSGELEMIPSKPVVTPPEGTNIPSPTSIDPNPIVTSSPPVQSNTAVVSSTETTLPQVADQDGDGLSDAREMELGTKAMVPDTDGDGLTDGDEVAKYRTNPLAPDTDGDSYPDSVEIQKGYNPLGPGQCANPACTL